MKRTQQTTIVNEYGSFLRSVSPLMGSGKSSIRVREVAHIRFHGKIFGLVAGLLCLLPVLGLSAKPSDIPPGAVPESLVSFGPDKGTPYAVIVEKDTQTLFVFTHTGSPTEVLRFPCSTGEAEGPKTRSGDSKTPEGIYFFTKEHLKKDLAPIYGTRAFPIDYPNALDRVAGRDGNSIWLHGTNKPLKPKDSNGCIVLENEDIDRVAKYITLNRTPMIILDRISYAQHPSVAAEESGIGRLVRNWTDALQNGTYHQYLSFYDPGYLPEMAWWNDWHRLKTTLDAKPSVVSLRTAAYKFKDVFAVLFDQALQFEDKLLPVGTRKFFLKYGGQTLRIVGDEYQALAATGAASLKENPLIAACRSLTPAAETEENIEEMVRSWLKAWSGKDIQKYGGFYARNFQSQGMNRKQWLRHKDRLNRKYDYIQVAADDMEIRKNADQYSVTFRQTYTSPAFRAVGSKELVLVRENGRWKIYRETWTKQ